MFQTDFRTAQIGSDEFSWNWFHEKNKNKRFSRIIGVETWCFTLYWVAFSLDFRLLWPQLLDLGGCTLTHFKMSFPYFLVKLHYNNFEQLNKAVNCDFKLTTFVFDPLYSNLNLNSMCCVLLDLARVSNICFDFRLVFTLVRYYFTTLRSNAHTVVIEAVEAVLVGELEAVGRTR